MGIIRQRVVGASQDELLGTIHISLLGILMGDLGHRQAQQCHHMTEKTAKEFSWKFLTQVKVCLTAGEMGQEVVEHFCLEVLWCGGDGGGRVIGLGYLFLVLAATCPKTCGNPVGI